MTTATLSRTSDPITSKIAGKTVDTLPMKERLLLEYVQKSMTSEEAAERAGLLDRGYWKRVSDLVNAGMLTERTQSNVPKDFPEYRIYRNGKPLFAVLRQQRSGKHAIVWQITDKGRAAARALKKAMKS